MPFNVCQKRSLPGTYELDTAQYDRSGRMNFDGLHIDPAEGWVDPLDDYFGSGLFDFIGGGIRGIPELDEEPVHLPLDLNEWFGFDHPGKYRYYVTSPRVQHLRVPGKSELNDGPILITSNVLEFEILPADSDWATRQLNNATRILDSNSTPEEKIDAARTLRHLGSQAAVEEMSRRFQGSQDGLDWEYKFGLIGSPCRSFVISQMNALLQDPKHPVTSAFLETLAALSFLGDNPQRWQPPIGAAAWMEAAEKRRAAFREYESRFVRRLAEALPAKGPQARALTLETLLLWAGDREFPPTSEQKDLLGQVVNELPIAFSGLPADEQFSVLDGFQKELSRPAMIPVLVHIVENPPDTVWPVQESALRILQNLAPIQWRRLVLAEISKPKPQMEVELLAKLPDSTLPELDGTFADHLDECLAAEECSGRDVENLARLIQRYATSSILPRIRDVYERRGYDMGFFARVALIAYFVRTDPEFAVLPIEKHYAELSAEKPDLSAETIYLNLLDQVALLQTAPQLEQLALRHLADEDWRVAGDCAHFLGSYGNASDESKLWKRLEGGRDQAGSTTANTVAPNEKLEVDLAQSIAFGSAWWTGPTNLKRMRNLCRTQGCQEEVDRLLGKWTQPLQLDVFRDNSSTQVNFAHYEFDSLNAAKRKLTQFPKGTIFVWNATTPTDPTLADKLFAEMAKFLAECGITLMK